MKLSPRIGDFPSTFLFGTMDLQVSLALYVSQCLRRVFSGCCTKRNPGCWGLGGQAEELARHLSLSAHSCDTAFPKLSFLRQTCAPFLFSELNCDLGSRGTAGCVRPENWPSVPTTRAVYYLTSDMPILCVQSSARWRWLECQKGWRNSARWLEMWDTLASWGF